MSLSYHKYDNVEKSYLWHIMTQPTWQDSVVRTVCAEFGVSLPFDVQ